MDCFITKPIFNYQMHKLLVQSDLIKWEEEIALQINISEDLNQNTKSYQSDKL